MDNEKTLKVRMLGGFALSWDGKDLTAGSKSEDTQLARLLQVLLHNRVKGVERSKLMQVLDEDSNAEDVHHLLRSVLYNLRKKLKAAGLPETIRIEFRDGRYYWTGDVPVEEDAECFEKLYAKAKAEEDPALREKYYTDACFMYKGEFLPYQTRLAWVSEEDRKYSQIFTECVDAAAESMRARHDYESLKKLGLHASKMSPYNEWEALTMEAMVSLGNFHDAQTLYEQTVELYQKEMGVKPSLNMIAKLEVFSARLEHRSATPETILGMLSEDNIGRGGFFCSYPIFQGIYRMMRRSMDRCGRYAFLMIVTLTNYNTIEDTSDMSPDLEALNKLSDRMKNVISNSVRRSDIVCRFAKDQFLLILMNRDIEGCWVVRDRINRNFRLGGYNISLEYDITPVREVDQKEKEAEEKLRAAEQKAKAYEQNGSLIELY